MSGWCRIHGQKWPCDGDLPHFQQPGKTVLQILWERYSESQKKDRLLNTRQSLSTHRLWIQLDDEIKRLGRGT